MRADVDWRRTDVSGRSTRVGRRERAVVPAELRRGVRSPLWRTAAMAADRFGTVASPQRQIRCHDRIDSCVRMKLGTHELRNTTESAASTLPSSLKSPGKLGADDADERRSCVCHSVSSRRPDWMVRAVRHRSAGADELAEQHIVGRVDAAVVVEIAGQRRRDDRRTTSTDVIFDLADERLACPGRYQTRPSGTARPRSVDERPGPRCRSCVRAGTDRSAWVPSTSPVTASVNDKSLVGFERAVVVPIDPAAEAAADTGHGDLQAC